MDVAGKFECTCMCKNEWPVLAYPTHCDLVSWHKYPVIVMNGSMVRKRSTREILPPRKQKTSGCITGQLSLGIYLGVYFCNVHSFLANNCISVIPMKEKSKARPAIH